jgi:uncharacterized membrane protein (UPF0127 family)
MKRKRIGMDIIYISYSGVVLRSYHAIPCHDAVWRCRVGQFALFTSSDPFTWNAYHPVMRGC